MLLPKLVRGLVALSLANVAFAADKPLYPRQNGSETGSGGGAQAKGVDHEDYDWNPWKKKTVTETMVDTTTVT